MTSGIQNVILTFSLPFISILLVWGLFVPFLWQKLRNNYDVESGLCVLFYLECYLLLGLVAGRYTGSPCGNTNWNFSYSSRCCIVGAKELVIMVVHGKNPHPRDLLSGFWEHIDLGGAICSQRNTCKQAEAPLVNRRPWRRVPELIPNNRDNTNQWLFIIMFKSVKNVHKPTVCGLSAGISPNSNLFFS